MSEGLFFHVRSTQWPILPGEADELVNEGMYGRACAHYLQTKLASLGYQAPIVASEDWGWWVGLEGFEGRCGIGIYGRQIDESDQLDICLTVHAPARKKWSWRKLKFVDQASLIDRLQQALRTILVTDPQITVVGEFAEFPWD